MVLSLFIWIALSMRVTHAPPVENASQWKIIKNTDGVQTLIRWVTYESGLTFRERKGMILAKCPIKDAVLHITSPSSVKNWMANVEDHYNIKMNNRNEWYAYTLFDISWPLNKRDMVSLYTVHADSTGITTITITSREEYLPYKPDISRLKKYHATWQLIPKGESLQISLHVISQTPPEFPRYIQDPLIDRVFHNNLIRLKEMLESNGEPS